MLYRKVIQLLVNNPSNFLFVHRILDLSFNRISKIEGLEGLTRLVKLFLVNNKISVIENLGHLTRLEMLELGDNRIRVSDYSFSLESIMREIKKPDINESTEPYICENNAVRNFHGLKSLEAEVFLCIGLGLKLFVFSLNNICGC